MPTVRLDNQLCFALYSASSRLTAIYRPILAQHDITYTQFVVMMALWEMDGISISALAGKTGLTNATMTPLLRRLETKGLISRQIESNNERQKKIKLTASGKKLSAYSEEITSQAFCATGLTKKQATEMIKHCHTIAFPKDSV